MISFKTSLHILIRVKNQKWPKIQDPSRKTKFHTEEAPHFSHQPTPHNKRLNQEE
jgi:hypothetical protein